jgi:hypothetical protein
MADVSRKVSRSKERLQSKQPSLQQSEIETNESTNVMLGVRSLQTGDFSF